MGRYFVTDESGFNRVWQFQGNSVSSFPTVPGGFRHGPIVVDGNTVRTVQGGFVGPDAGNPGSAYSTAGVVQGPLNLNFSAHGLQGRVIDAGFNGSSAFIVSGFIGGRPSGVFEYNADFSGPGTLLFALTGDAALAQGITYDTATNTIWTSDYDFTLDGRTNGGEIRQFDLDGNQLFSFRAVDADGNPSERNTALAYDPTDDTFWFNAHVENTLGLGVGELWQFDRNGNFLQKIHIRQLDPNERPVLYWGGEFAIAPVPEPASIAVWSLLLLTGVVVVWMRRRRAVPALN